MKHLKGLKFYSIFICVLLLSGCSQKTEKDSQIHYPKGSRDTRDKKIEQQPRKVFSFEESGVWFSNKFLGGRIGKLTQVNADTFELLSKPENFPINNSPWYAFQVWGSSNSKNSNIIVRLTYPDSTQDSTRQYGKHRYYPKISKDGKHWQRLDKARYQVDTTRNIAELKLPLSNDTLWVAAQELLTSKDIKQWVNRLAEKNYVKKSSIGQSELKKNILKLEITESLTSPKHLIIIGRQHPPEVTGSIALMSFVNEIASDSDSAKKFRQRFKVIVIPLVNPDGVDEGHWRHNLKGVDLNRDWAKFNQKETSIIKDNLSSNLTNKDVYFAIDFHSTYSDLFYILQDKAPREISLEWIKRLEKNLPDYKYDYKKVARDTPASMIWFYKTFGIDAVTYEVGDETERNDTREIARVAANTLMELLMEIASESKS